MHGYYIGKGLAIAAMWGVVGVVGFVTRDTTLILQLFALSVIATIFVM